MRYVTEIQKNVPIVAETDVCVVGGSCTGVFAAVRAARLGAQVVLVERQNAFGGVATAGLVNVWHSLQDTSGSIPIIGGLTREVLDRLARRPGALMTPSRPTDAFRLNTEELKIELDELVTETAVRPMLHTGYAAPFVRDGNLEGVFVENKSGRGLVRARVLVDATGDGDLCAHLGIESRSLDDKQPPTSCARMAGLAKLDRAELRTLLREHGAEFGLEPDCGWSGPAPGAPGLTFHAETHVFGVDCARAEDLTRSEIEGRRQIRAILDIVRKYRPDLPVALVDLCSCIGVRETRHVRCAYRLTGDDVLAGRRFEDAIANGTYPMDIHHHDKPGWTIRRLDGFQWNAGDGGACLSDAGHPEGGEPPRFYQIPFRCLLPAGPYGNLVAAGRMIDADKNAYGAIRVMVNLNQTGEAAGVAAYLAAHTAKAMREIEASAVRRTLAEGGAIVL